LNSEEEALESYPISIDEIDQVRPKNSQIIGGIGIDFLTSKMDVTGFAHEEYSNINIGKIATSFSAGH